MFFPFYWPLWYLELCTGNTSLPSLREISRRAVRACNSISLGAKGATCVCAGQGVHGGAAGPVIRAVT